MRAIKFRIWDKTENAWIDNTSEWSISLNGDVLLEFPEETLVMDMKYFEIVEYPGLKDKNGKDICEGDILQFKYFDDSLDVGKLSYQDGQWVIEGVCKTWNNQIPFCINLCGNQDIVEIIGNVYDDPELLEGD